MQVNQQETNQKFKYEKIKKILNNPTIKFLLSSVGSVAGIGTLGLVAKLIYDKTHQNKVYNELVIDNDITLSIADQTWIAKNMILFAQQYPLCWHNVFMQLLACPEYIHYSNDPDHLIHKSKKIMTMINFAKKNLPGILSEGKLKVPKVKVPMEVRQMPDDVLSEDVSGNLVLDNHMPNKCWLTDGKKHGFVLHKPGYYYYDGDFRFDNILLNELGILDTPCTEYCGSDEILRWEDGEPLRVEKPTKEVNEARVLAARQNGEINVTYGWSDYTTKNDAMKYYGKKFENILNYYGNYTKYDFSFKDINCCQECSLSSKDINCCQEYGYYPTFVVIFDNVDYSSIPHYHCCYIVYDKNKNIKYFLWGDGIKDSFRVMSANKSLERLNKYSSIWVKYSRSDVVEEFYTPELMYNAN